jgi:hypothetical protein
VKASNSSGRILIFDSFYYLLSCFSLTLFLFFDLTFYCLLSFLFSFLLPFVFPYFSLLFYTYFFTHVISSLVYPNLFENKRLGYFCCCSLVGGYIFSC